jgi:hypothetical protein
MNLFKPSTWFKTPAISVFVKLQPDWPHQGLDLVSTDLAHGFEKVMKVTGISKEEARLHLVGKVLDWPKLSDKQWKAIESGKPIEMAFEDLKKLFR